MMIDTRPIETMTSLMVTATVATMSLGWPVMFGLTAMVFVSDSLPAAALMCCIALPAPLLGLGLQVLLRWTRRGQGHLYLQEVADELGGEVSAGTVLLPLLQPRLLTSIEGRDVDVVLRRTGGFLTPSRPDAGGFLPWTLQLRVQGKVPRKVGFMPADAATMGAGLLGLSEPVPRDGVTVFTGGHPEVADDEAVLEAARALTRDKLALVIAGPTGLHITDRPKGVDAATLARRVRAAVTLLMAVEAALPADR